MTNEEIKQKIREIKSLGEEYLRSCKFSKAGDDAVEAFFRWYDSVILLFHVCKLDNQEDVKWLKDQRESISDNGLDMYALFNKFRPKYNILLNDIEHGNIFYQTQKSTEGEVLEGMNPPIVVISHASEDICIISEFIDQILKNGLGLSDENIVCTSLERTTVSLGDNIPAYILKKIEQSSVVLSMVSQAYKKSEPCQNEVGAAWALKRKPISIILPDADFCELGWLVNLDKAGRIDNADFLNHLQEDLCSRLGLIPQTALHWNPCVTKFLENVKALTSKSKAKVD